MSCPYPIGTRVRWDTGVCRARTGAPILLVGTVVEYHAPGTAIVTDHYGGIYEVDDRRLAVAS